jgi:hypothetical protein
MSWLEYHTWSEQHAIKAEAASKLHDNVLATKHYGLAAEAEVKALNCLGFDKTRTIGITVVSATSLYLMAQDFSQAKKVAQEWLATDFLPPFAIEELNNLLENLQSSSIDLNALEQLLFPEKMNNRDLLRRSPHAEFFLKISSQIAGKSRQEIYSYFDQCTAQLNLDFANWLNDWGNARFVDEKHHPEIEKILNTLAAIWDFPRGNRAGNLEIFLVANQLQLLFVAREEYLKSWANIQNNLAAAYIIRMVRIQV